MYIYACKQAHYMDHNVSGRPGIFTSVPCAGTPIGLRSYSYLLIPLNILPALGGKLITLCEISSVQRKLQGHWNYGETISILCPCRKYSLA